VIPTATPDIQAKLQSAGLNRSSKLLLAGTILLFTLVELTVRFGIGKVSRIEGRIEGERRTVLSLTHGSGKSDAKSLLMIGNSLLLEGVDFPRLRQFLAPDISTVRFAVEQTNYLDWYYCLRNFYDHNVRQDVVALSLTSTQSFTNDIRGEYFAYRMMNTRDFLRVSHDAHLSATETFSLLVGNLSAFYGTRSETRKVLLAKLVPSVNELIPSFVPAPAAAPPRKEIVVERIAQRLRVVDGLVRRNGGRLIMISPASLDAQGVECLSEGGRKAGVVVLTPIAAKDLSPRDFRDGFHLTQAGAARYTTALAPLLRDAIRKVLR
jgi:hypothetical protein